MRELNKKTSIIIWDNKKEWVNKRKELYRRILTSNYIPDSSKKRVSDYPKGLWETPKTFVDGYAYNDGTWLKYNTCRVKGGKFHNKVYCKTKKDVIEQLYSYMCFLKKIGINNTMEMWYFAVCHIIWKLTFSKGMYEPNKTNLTKMEKLATTVQRNDVICERRDTRQYCIDPKLKKGKTSGQVIGLQRKKDKDMRWNRIKELYDSTLTNQQNLDKMKDNGLEISESTLHRWKRGCHMVSEDHNASDNKH
ncbi:MAG: hypothetical protein J5705_04740 [Bacteroidaceae bacterium]|nr:hypothetical protein [Bacteroidaceae bacterium]